jgi:hypothetical protein
MDIVSCEPILVKQQIDMMFPIYTFDLSEKINISEVIDKIKQLKLNYPVSTMTNVICKNGWRSPYLHYNIHPELRLFDQVKHEIEKSVKLINSFDSSLTTLWAMIYHSNDYAEWHNHGSIWDNLSYNAVLYLTESKTPLVIKNGLSNVEIFPQAGMLVIMHPLTLHMVPTIQDEERIVLAANLS